MGKHAILVIKNGKNEYLQYYDKDWESYLFLNCKVDNVHDNISIINKIAEEFSITQDKIEINFAGEKTHKKFSQREKIEKEYTHYFYNVELDKKFEGSIFSINNIKYKWFSYEELLKNEKIKAVNSDIVGFVREFNM